MSKRTKCTLIIVAIIVVSLILILTGCHKPVESEIGARLTTEEAKKEVVISITEMKERMKRARATDILRFIFVLAIAAGVYAWIRGNSGGTAVIVAGVVGVAAVQLDQKLAELPALYVVGVGLIFAGFVLFLYRDQIGKAAFRKNLNGGELTKAEQKIVNKAKKKKE